MTKIITIFKNKIEFFYSSSTSHLPTYKSIECYTLNIQQVLSCMLIDFSQHLLDEIMKEKKQDCFQ